MGYTDLLTHLKIKHLPKYWKDQSHNWLADVGINKEQKQYLWLRQVECSYLGESKRQDCYITSGMNFELFTYLKTKTDVSNPIGVTKPSFEKAVVCKCDDP